MPNTATAAPTCTRCNGTGEYHGTRRDGSTYTGSCFACQGTPFRYRRYVTRTERRDARALLGLPAEATAPAYIAPQDATVAAPAVALHPAVARFQAAYPAEYAWLAANAPTVDFAASLLRAIARYGNLTPRQLAAVQRNVARPAPAAAVEPVVEVATMGRDAGTAYDAAGNVVPNTLYTAPPAPAAVTIDCDRVRTAMDAAAASGLRKVRLTLGNVEFKLTGSRFRAGAGMIMAYYKVNGTFTYCGYVDRANVWHGGSFWLVNAVGQGSVSDLETLRAAAIDAFRTAAADPQAAARTHGQDTGYCSCCRRLLTDPPSVMAGIGPVCITRFGWSF